MLMEKIYGNLEHFTVNDCFYRVADALETTLYMGETKDKSWVTPEIEEMIK